MQTAVDAWPTRDVQLILQIVDGIYAAACGEGAWEQVLSRLCRFGGLDGAALGTVGATEPWRVPLASFGPVSRSDSRAVRGGAMAGDPALLESILRSPPGTVLRGGRIRSEPPTRWTGMPSGGSRAWACVIVGKDGRRVVCLEVHGGNLRALESPEPGDLLRQLASHLARAWRLGMASRPAAVAPLRVVSRSPSQADSAPAVDLGGLSETARLRAEFGLTKAEARLALRLAAGSSLASAAQAFDVKLTTIRSQLQQIFAKTGTSRQSELVAMLLCRGHGTPVPHATGRSVTTELARSSSAPI